MSKDSTAKSCLGSCSQGCFLWGCMPAMMLVLVCIYVTWINPDEDDESKYPTEYVASADSLSVDTIAVSQQAILHGEIPSRPVPARAVNDWAGLLNADPAFEDSLENLSKTTGAQIVVVTVNSLGDFTANDLATKIGNKWGVGHKGKDNGLVILIKKKTEEEKGQIYLATGTGMGAILPDALCKRIVDDVMIKDVLESSPYAYDAALWAGLKVIMPICRGEYTADEYIDKADSIDWVAWIYGIFSIIVLCGFYWLGTLFFTGSVGASLFGDEFANSGGDLGGGDSGFDFGGGSFDGGGAGGSW